MRNKKRDTKEAAFMVMTFLVIVGFFGYSYLREEMDTKTLVIGGMFLAFVFVWTMADVVVYRNKYFKPEDKDKSFFKRRRNEKKKTETYQKIFVGKDMYGVCEKYIRERNIEDTIIVFVILVGFDVLFLLMTFMSGNIRAIHWGFYVGVPLVVTGLFGIWTFCASKEVKRLKTFIAQSTYDEMLVNNDFMTSGKHFLTYGFVCVGMQYVVVCLFTKSFVFELSDVVWVEKVVDVYRSGKIVKLETEQFSVKILLKQGFVKLLCVDEISADLLVEEFKHRGYFNALEELYTHDIQTTSKTIKV